MKYGRYQDSKIFHIIEDSSYYDSPVCSDTYAIIVSYGDSIYDNPPIGRLCKNCKKKFIKEHSEAELMLELL